MILSAEKKMKRNFYFCVSFLCSKRFYFLWIGEDCVKNEIFEIWESNVQFWSLDCIIYVKSGKVVQWCFRLKLVHSSLSFVQQRAHFRKRQLPCGFIRTHQKSDERENENILRRLDKKWILIWKVISCYNLFMIYLYSAVIKIEKSSLIIRGQQNKFFVRLFTVVKQTISRVATLNCHDMIFP